MATVPLAFPAGPAPSGGHPKVTLISADGTVTVTLDITNAQTEVSGVADQWVEQERPELQPVLQRVGKRLAKFPIEAIIGGEDFERDISSTLEALTALGRSGQRVTVSLPSGGGQAVETTGGWIITDLSWRVLRRRHGDNAVTRAQVSIELTAGAGGSGIVTPGSSSSAGAAGAGSVGSGARRYTVREGETLSGIAAAQFPGVVDAWKWIAAANGITDPRTITAGQILNF